MDDLVEDGFFDCSSVMRCAIYALVRKGAVVYIGRSKKAWARVGTHCRTRNNKKPRSVGFVEHFMSGVFFDEIWVRPCMLGELYKFEIEMIKKYRPKYNVMHNPDAPKSGAPMPPEIRAMIERMSAVKEVEAEASPLFFNRRGL